MSDCVDKEPTSREAPVKVLVPFDHTSDTREPNEVRALVVLFHTDVAMVVVERTVAPTTKVLSSLTRSPLPIFPQVI